MRFNHLFIGTCALLTFCACNSNPDLQKDSLELDGDVKSVRTITYEAKEKFGELSEGKILNYEGENSLYNFSEDGRVSDVSIFNPNGELISKGIHKWNADGNIQSITYYDSDGDLDYKMACSYDENGIECKNVISDKSGKVISTSYKENDGKRVVKCVYLSEYSDGDYTKLEYDSDYDYTTVEYDKNGNKTGNYVEFKNGKITKAQYDGITAILKYNDKGCLVEITNAEMNVIGTVTWKEDVAFKYEHEYDNEGNWIRKIERDAKTGKPTRIFVREIEYY